MDFLLVDYSDKESPLGSTERAVLPFSVETEDEDATKALLWQAYRELRAFIEANPTGRPLELA